MTPRHRVLPVVLIGLLTAAAVAAPALAAAAEAAVDRQVTFTHDVAPIFMAKCVECHRPNELAPMSLLSYEEARPWAKSIRRAVAEREMPPWDAAPGPVAFANDISLNDEEIATIVAWVDQGAQRGEDRFMPEVPAFTSGWRLGPPDLVVDLPEYSVPADGEDLFPTVLVNLDLPEKRYLRGVELHVDNASILHHLVLFQGVLAMSDEVIDQRSPDAKKPNPLAQPGLLYVWAAGSPPGDFPEGIGRTLEANPVLSLNFHYHPYGEAATDTSKLGLYFTDEPPQRELVTATTVNPALHLPAGSKDYSLKSYHLFADDVRLVSLLPHMHQRGSAISYTLTYPDGRSERLLDVPRYDFNWQWIYYLAEPKFVPAGTWLEVEGHWDNSADNPNNPDASVDVEWGDGSNYEMLAGILDFVAVDSVRPKPPRLGQVIRDMLARHDSDTYTANLGMLPFGLHLPRTGTGMFYLVQSVATMSVDLPEIVWDGDRLITNLYFLRGAADSLPVGLAAELGPDGTIRGELFFGKHLTAESAKELAGQGQAFAGRRVVHEAVASGGG